MKRFTLILILISLTVGIVGCESGSNTINAVLIQDIMDNCPTEVVEINDSDAEYEVTVILDRPCIDEKIEEAQ